MSELFIGEKKVKEYTEESEGVKVVFEDDSKTSFTRKMFEVSKSFEPLDETKLQERRILAVQAELMALLLSWDMKLFDIHKMLQWTSNFLNEKHELADEKLWGNSYTARTIGNLERVLLREEGNNNPASS